MRTLTALALALTLVCARVATADEGAVSSDGLQAMCSLSSVVQGIGPVPRTAEDVVALKGYTASGP